MPWKKPPQQRSTPGLSPMRLPEPSALSMLNNPGDSPSRRTVACTGSPRTIQGRCWRGIRPAAGSRCSPPKTRKRDLLELYLPVSSGTAARPITIGHLGQSLDGFIATHSGDAISVTGPENILHLHRLRALCDAVVVGAGTVVADNPRLTTRLVVGSNPARVILDPACRLPAAHLVFSDRAGRDAASVHSGQRGWRAGARSRRTDAGGGHRGWRVGPCRSGAATSCLGLRPDFRGGRWRDRVLLSDRADCWIDCISPLRHCSSAKAVPRYACRPRRACRIVCGCNIASIAPAPTFCSIVTCAPRRRRRMVRASFHPWRCAGFCSATPANACAMRAQACGQSGKVLRDVGGTRGQGLKPRRFIQHAGQRALQLTRIPRRHEQSGLRADHFRNGTRAGADDRQTM